MFSLNWDGINASIKERLNLEKLWKVADPEKISAAVSQQVEIVGLRSLYERIDKNFKKQKSEALFAKVKFIL